MLIWCIFITRIAYNAMAKDCVPYILPQAGTVPSAGQSLPKLPDLRDDDEKWDRVAKSITEKLGQLKQAYPNLWVEPMDVVAN